MAKSLSLALYLKAAARGPAGLVPKRPARPKGSVVWLHAGYDTAASSLVPLAQLIRRGRDGVHLLITTEREALGETARFPEGTVTDVLPDDRLPDLLPFLDHWKPDLAVLTGPGLPPALIATLHDRKAPIILADVGFGARHAAEWRWQRGMAMSLLRRITRILARDSDSARRLDKLGGGGLAIDIIGRIEETTDPLPCTEAERAVLAELLGARPVWLAMACSQDEEDTVIAAHQHAMRQAHRMLLILVPADATRAPEIAERVGHLGWVSATRSREQEPDPDVQVFIADSEGELGLWYRLAPVTFMGGTLSPGGSGRNPYEPAALGSAIVHGPHFGPYAAAYARFVDARASRQVDGPAALATAVGELIAPDKAATLAHNAWAMSSGGAEVAERVSEIILATLDARMARKAG
ncbi:MAG: glycosyltransferase N-terminal domain-containing protein [Paracoccaceae bacterium]